MAKKFNNDQLGDFAHTLNQIANIVDKIFKTLDPEKVSKLTKEIEKLNKTLPSEFQLSKSQLNRADISKVVTKVRNQYQTGNNVFVNYQQSAALEDLLESSIKSEIERYKKQLAKAFDKLPENLQKQYKSKDAYVAQYGEMFSRKFYNVARNTYEADLNFNSKFGTTPTKRDVISAVTSARNEVEEDIVESQSKAAKDLEAGAKKFKDASSILLDLGNTILKYFTQGISKQYNVYRDTYGDFSARTNIDQNTYINQQLKSAHSLRNNQVIDGATLLDNVSMAELMQTWDNLAKIGMRQEDIFAHAIDNVVTSKIVPYLDTTSLSVNLLNERLNGNFIKDIRGITNANLEIAENNYATQKLLQTIIDEVQPMSDEALQNLALGSTEVTAMINSLIGQGIDESTAISYATQLFKGQKYSDQMLRSGSTAEKMYVAGALEGGINFYDPSQWNDALGLMINQEQMMMSGQDYNSTMGGLLANIVGNTFGLDYGRRQAAINLTKKGITGTSLVNKTNLTQTDIKDGANEALKSFANGMFQTAEEKQLNATENLSTELATLQERLGSFGTDLLGMVGNIYHAIIGTGAANTLVSALGLGGESGGLTALLGSAGPIALGVAAAGTAIVGGVVAGINWAQDDFNKADEARREIGGNAEAMYNAQGKSSAASAINAVADIRTIEDSHNLTDNFGLTSEMAEYLGIEKDWKKGSKDEINSALDKYRKEKNPKAYNRIKFEIWKNQAGAGLPYEMIALLTALNLKGLDKDTAIMDPLREIFNIQGLSADTNSINEMISDYMGDNFIQSANYIAKHYNNLKSMDIYPLTSQGKYYSYDNITEDKLKEKFNLNRQGLATVPYDEYPALLHAGETIMTASTTATMESMVQAFRESQNQNYRLDAAIQEQTAQLVSKIDEVINAIGSRSFGTTNTNTPSERLRESLRTLTSPLAFQG